MKKIILTTVITSSFFVGCVSNKINYPALDTTNPLLADWTGEYGEPPLEQIKVEHFEPAFDAAIEYARLEAQAITEQESEPTFENTIVALERQGALLDKVSGVFYALLHSNTSPEMEQVSLDVQPKLTELSNDISLDEKLFERVSAVYHNPPKDMDAADKMLLEECYKGFERGGAALSPEKKDKYREITTELGRLTLEFGQNILAATNAYTYNIKDKALIEELPTTLQDGMAADAAARGEEGWTVTLKAPSYIPFLTYSSQRGIKETLWREYNTRSVGGDNDNTQTLKRIVNLRLELAQLMGFENYAQYALERRMAQRPDRVNAFLEELLTATAERGREDVAAIVDYARENGFEGEFMPWDFPYYAEKYKDANYSLSDEMVKPYLEIGAVRSGVFMLAEKLFGLQFIEKEGIEIYHEDVEVFDVKDADGSHLGLLYLDFFPRESKSGGAWMTEFRGQECEQRPFINLVMNFSKPTENSPSLLTFTEFETLLHEFGHGLHGLLAKGKYGSLTGTNVYRDFVELPSQLLENWATESEYLVLWAKHYKTGEPMPQDLIKRIERAARFNAGYASVRQLQFGLLDMAWHTLSQPYEGSVEEFERAACSRTQILPSIDGAIFSPSFSHIFAGGYAAGYYSYKWAEVLDADAFTLFKQKGLFDKETANRLRHSILERGGERHPMELYIEYRGAEPSPQALIERTLGK